MSQRTGASDDAEDPTARTRRALLDAVIQIAGTQGIEKVTYRAVAAEAGLSHSLVRFYFGTGEAMLTEALEHAVNLDATEGHLLAEDLQTFGSDFTESVSNNKIRQLLQYDYLLRAVRGGIPIENVVALYDYYQHQIGGTLDNLGVDDDDGSMAALILAVFDGLVLQHVIYGSDERTEAVLARLRSIVGALQTATNGGE